MSCRGEEISAILVRKLQAYEEFRSVTGLLRTALESDEINEVNRCIARREELMRGIDELDRQIDRRRRTAPPDQHPAIDRILADMSGKLGEALKGIIATDHDCAAIASRRQEETRKELAVVRHQKEGVHGYALKSAGTPRFLNVRT